MTETSVLEVPIREVGYQGETLKVTPLKIGQIPGFSRAIGPMFSALAHVFTSIPLGDGSGGSGNPKSDAELLVDSEELVQVMGEHGDRMIDAAVVATGAKREVIAEGNPVEFFDLVTAVIEVNADFFARAMAKARAAGPKQSSS